MSKSTNEVLGTANGPVMWILAILAIVIVIIQSVMIYRLTKQRAKGGIMSDEEIKVCLKTGGVTAVGPAIAVFILAMSMLNMLGAPMTLMRIGMIGSADTELLVSSMGTSIAGVTLGTDELTYAAFGTALLACAITSGGYFILTPILCRGLGGSVTKLFTSKDKNKKSGKAGKFIKAFFSAIFPLLIFAGLAASQAAQGVDYLIVMLIAAVVMFILNRLSKTKNITWLKEWAMGFSVLSGIICGPIIASIIK